MSDIQIGCVVAFAGSLLLGSIVAAAAPPQSLMVLAPDVLKPALEPIAAAWVANGGKPVVISYGPSGEAVQKVKSGTQVDVLITSDSASMDDAVKAGLIKPQTRQNNIGNDLVLVSSAEGAAPLKIASGFDLAGKVGDSKLALCAPLSCPAGVFGKQSLDALKIWSAVQPKLVQPEDAAKTLLLVTHGDARFGIVFTTDAKTEPKVKIVDTFPYSTHDPIVYPMAVVKASIDPDAARFEAYMRSSQATRIFLSLGFRIGK